MAPEEEMKRALVLLVALALAGCVSLIPGAEKVRITRNPQDIVNCKVVGQERVFSKENEEKQHVFVEGGDTVLVTFKFGWNKVGVPYNCSGVDPRQPVPVTTPK
jgi:hypothetical protein